MAFKAEIPYGAYWSTPFARWQGAFANLNSIEFAAHVTRKELAHARLGAESHGRCQGPELERAAGVPRRDHGLARQERFQRHVAVVFVEVE